MAHDFKRGMKFPYNEVNNLSVLQMDDAPLLTYFCDGEPSVKTGDTVFVGSVLGYSGSRAVLSGVSGAVSSAENGRIVIENDNGSALCPEFQPYGVKTGKTVSQLDIDGLCGVVKDSGTLTDDGKPLEELLSKAYGRVKTLVVNGVSTEDSDLVSCTLLENYHSQIRSAMKIVMSVFGIKRGIIVLARHSKGLYNTLEKTLSGQRLIKIERVSDSYPMQNTNLLLYALSGKELSPLHESYVSSYLVLTPKICLDIYNAFAFGYPSTHTFVTVNTLSGERAVVRLPVGTPVSHICQKFGINGGLLTGMPLAERLADKDGFVRAEDTRFTERKVQSRIHGLCNKCGDCIDACPMYLYPYEFAFAGKKHALSCGINVCIQCGLCSLVCPSSYPLNEKIRRLKSEVRADGSLVDNKNGDDKIKEGKENEAD